MPDQDPRSQPTICDDRPGAAVSPFAPSPARPPASASIDVPPEVQLALADPGRRFGNYVILRELGRGGMGVVFHAFDVALRRSVAVKVVLEPDQIGEEELRRFRREARAAAGLRHPGIVAVHEVGDLDGKPFIVMELVEGESLESLMRRAPLPPRRIAELVRGVALALHHAHRHGVVHRDVKPENVLVDGEGRPRVVDFGLALDLKVRTRLTASGEVLGTPAYMAPEQLLGERRSHGPPSDIYALGGLLYRALVGRPPFEATSVAALFAKVLRDEPLSPRSLNPDVPEDLDAITLRCLAKGPGERFGSADDVAEALGQFLAFAPRTQSKESRDGAGVARSGSLLGAGAGRWVRAVALVVIGVMIGVAATAAIAGRPAPDAHLAGLRERARREAASARAAFATARVGQEQPSALDLGLDSIEACTVSARLSPDDAEELARAFQNAVAVGDRAREADELGLAAYAYARAERVALGAEQLDRAREKQRALADLAREWLDGYKRFREILLPELEMARDANGIATALDGLRTSAARKLAPQHDQAWVREALERYSRRARAWTKVPATFVLVRGGVYSLVRTGESRTLEDFFIDANECTQACWAEWLDAEGGSAVRPPSLEGSMDVPVTNVTSDEVGRFAAWRTKRADGLVTFRLPSEWEWEKAARGAGGQDYPWGRTFTQNRDEGRAALGGRVVPVRLFQANDLGLFDTVGNVAELTDTVVQGQRVVKGGSATTTPPGAAASGRDLLDPSAERSSFIGFRLVAALKE